MENTHISLPIFAGENYEFWCKKMKTLLASLDLWEIVDEGYDDEEGDLTVAQLKELKKLRRNDAMALSKIQQAVADSIFPRIMRAEKSKEAWEILQKEFGGDEKVRVIKLQTLRRDFENLKMNEKESLGEFNSRFIELTNQMKTYGEEISDQRMIEKILICLPERFNAIVAVIEQTKDISQMSIHELMGSLKSFEERLSRQSEKPIESAFQTKMNMSTKNDGESSLSGEKKYRGGNFGRGRGRGRNSRGRGRGFYERNQNKTENEKKCSHCGRSSHEYKDCWFKDKPKCHKCGRFGHLQKECYSNTQPQNQQQANYIEEKQGEGNMFYASQNASEKRNDVWYIDSGCSNHMTGDKSIFVSIDTSINSQVKMGNGALVKAQGKGTISVNTKKGERRIHDVLLVPDLEQNLLSVGQLIEHGYAVHFEGKTCAILDKMEPNHVMARIPMEKNRNFPLTFKYAENMAMKAQVMDESWLWHLRLGHLNFQSLKVLHNKNMVHGLSKIEEMQHVCEGCALGKHHRQPFPKGVAWRAKQPLELVHTDVCGPMSTISHGNNRYFILFIDDFTRMTWVYFLKQKSEVFGMFKKFKYLVEKQSGRSIKVLRSDNGKEYTSNQFTKFCEDEGIGRQLSVGYTPQQNGVSERKNQTVMEMAKSMLH